MPINRRVFLHAVGLGAAAATVAGCSGTQNASPPQRPTSGAAHAPIDFYGLAAKLSGPVVTSGQPGYDVARRSFKPLFDNRRPAAVAQCQRIEDVQACVSAAAAEGMPIAARSGGHSYAG